MFKWLAKIISNNNPVVQLPKFKRGRNYDFSVVGGSDWLPIIKGESFYQDAFLQITGGYKRNGHATLVDVILVPEPTNEHDANAVAAYVDGCKVGYLAREYAAALSPKMECRRFRVDGRIVGGWRKNQYCRGYFGLEISLSMAENGQVGLQFERTH
jgi:hypothetical protein